MLQDFRPCRQWEPRVPTSVTQVAVFRNEAGTPRITGTLRLEYTAAHGSTACDPRWPMGLENSNRGWILSFLDRAKLLSARTPGRGDATAACDVTYVVGLIWKQILRVGRILRVKGEDNGLEEREHRGLERGKGLWPNADNSAPSMSGLGLISSLWSSWFSQCVCRNTSSLWKGAAGYRHLNRISGSEKRKKVKN